MVNWDNSWQMPQYNNNAWARSISKVKIDVSDFSSLTFLGGNFNVDNYSGNTGLRFALATSSDGSRRNSEK